ncbi:retrovirus polyprotein, putative [Talaromyces stipitatus ATCC 10500]|uniref:Retrovirus polyprotein, putative n=1 Tax=Talaromyces stipitatus (strain ATCC 10500 / CBS 375.48 / QM 6759 / NRRL 1006) TaxID=441959 RepID=B8LTM4_TALSN|nr:retrovirus polyprotein, putative [Talaromyces stipitatus ATCC 10500]EED23616.1 retrovirus polyprotein, putative [Talaromyces stipitatus ATCC 10500]
MANIDKALTPKAKTDPRTALPNYLQDYTNVFDPVEADRLPEHRPGANYTIELIEQDKNGKKLEAPWGPLYNMSQEELLVDTADKAFQDLKDLFITEPALVPFNPERKTIMETNSLGYMNGGTLSQYNDEGQLQTCAYYSWKLNPAECNYEIHDKELLAIIDCIKQWEAELMSLESPFTILTNDEQFRSLWTQAEAHDDNYIRIKQVIADNLQTFPQDLGLKVKIANCKIDKQGHLLYRDRRWVPDYEPLQTKIMQYYHDLK